MLDAALREQTGCRATSALCGECSRNEKGASQAGRQCAWGQTCALLRGEVLGAGPSLQRLRGPSDSNVEAAHYVLWERVA